MSNLAIRVESLGKRYRIGGSAEPYRTFREALVGAGRAPLRRLRRLSRLRPTGAASAGEEPETFWALRDVSFEVEHGEVLGIVGRNGAGKSTLLKILSRITRPTTGQARVTGRVGSLLEVGTGFHPELTGRDNVYLNGSILGMDRRYIKRRFDEIVSFAGIEKFVDTPVKRYSSGMYLRLAFAVAAHLEPEVLVVDEVLAVGDAEFQKRCMGKMGEVAQEGRTVLLVSHNMAAIQNLCRNAILLGDGGVRAQGPVSAVVEQYLSVASEMSRTPLASRSDREGSGDLRFQRIAVRNGAGEAAQALISGETARIVLDCCNPSGRTLRNLTFAVGVDNSAGQRITVLSSEMTGDTLAVLPPGRHPVEIEIPRLPLAPGRYGLTLFASHNGGIADWVQNAGTVDVEAGDFFGTGRLPPASQGDFLMACRFRTGGAG